MATSSNQHGATAAPPPTPSTQATSSDAAESLSQLFLLRLPPILSPPSRRNSRTTSTSIPTISLSNPTITPSLLLSAASKLGFFQLTNHSIPSQLAHSADSDSQSLFHLPNHQKRLRFPPNWPLGYACGDEDEETTESSFCFDSLCSTTESNELSLASLREFTREMEKVGLAVIEALSCAVGFVNPVRANPSRICSLMWISEDTTSQSPGNDQLLSPGKIYPYVVGLHYQVRCRKSTMLSDSGWVSVSPQVDSILVTLGDIAQVWSNGKLKKVRGRPRPVPTLAEGNSASKSISMSLLLTLPLDSIVSPLILPTIVDDGSDEVESRSEDQVNEVSRVFNSFSFEDYAWRVYHERVLNILKDPLVRYRP